ncbi:(2Fe-2S)-binding protein [Streptomyces sp. URMC 127]|uniref:(2Fe-2S)-binding protein n=1 Tax=Streptomyces sp. URMC 127 TaxID=3423402 RepID=UPI003F196E58
MAPSPSAPSAPSTRSAPPAPDAPAAPSPLADAYARLAGVYQGLTLTAGPPLTGEGWLTAAALAEGGAGLEAFLAWDDAQILREYGERARPDVVASFGLHRYAWASCLLLTVPWFLGRRVPRLPPAAVSLHRGEGRLTAFATEFACLPGDPAAELPGARAVPCEEALRAELRAAVAAHFTPVLEGFRPRMRRGQRALWGMVTDELAESLWYVGRLLGEEERSRRELALLLPGVTPPYVGGAAFRMLTGRMGEPIPTRDRASCCLFYTLRPQDTCTTCPRTCDADRVDRLSVS